MKNSKVSILLAVVMLISLFIPSLPVEAETLPGYKISGYVAPSFINEDNASTVKKSGFKVEMLGIPQTLSAITDSDGYFELVGVPKTQTGRIRISKITYLTRESNLPVAGDRQISSKDAPLEMMVGDLPVKGVQDNCINLKDIMELTSSFFTVIGHPKYNELYDFDSDTAINFGDIMYIAQNFNKASWDYLPLPDLTYKDSSLPVDQRLNNLLSQMTLDEKIGQMLQGENTTTKKSDVKDYCIGSVFSGGGAAPIDNTPEGWMDMMKGYQDSAAATRLGIPIIYGSDAVHGHNNLAGSTIFPHNIGLGAAADPELMAEIGRVTAEEMLATGVLWDFSPCVAVGRDERWGRTYESYSENHELVSMLATPLYKTLQGEYGIVTSAKHYVADGGTNGGTDQGNAVITEEELRRVHLPVYKKAIDSGVKSVMLSFSSWNGLKMHENEYLITDVLKGELGFKGFVVSDWEAIHQINAPTLYEQVVKCINAGVDMLMEPDHWKDCYGHIKSAVAYRDISIDRIDDAVRRILKVKFEMGLFEKPLGDQSLVKSSVGSDEHRDVARKAARESLVLLKNNNNILPLKKNAKIYVAGPAANNIGVQCGGWTLSWQGGVDTASSRWMKGTTILEGFKKIASQNGGTIITDPLKAKTADLAVVVIGEKPYAEGKGDDDNRLALSGGTVMLSGGLEAIKTAKDAGLPVVVIMVSGRPRIVTDQIDKWDAFVQAWLPGTEGDAVAQVLYGDYDFKGKLPMTWPKSYDQLPINFDDMGTKVPLFPYGYGLTMNIATPDPNATPTLTPTPTAAPTPTPDGTFRELTENTSNVGSWTLNSISNTSVSASVYGTGVKAEIVSTGTSEDDIQIVHTEPYQLEGGAYEMKLYVTSNTDRLARIAVEKADDTMEAIADKEVSLKSGDNFITVPFSFKNKTSVKLSVRLGYFEADGTIAPHNVTVMLPDFTRTGDYIDPVEPVAEDPDRFKNRVLNGDFSKGKDGWWGIEPVDGVGIMSAEGGKTNPWDVMCGYYSTFKLAKERTYAVSFDFASETAQKIKFQIVNADNKDAELTLKTFDVPGDGEMHTYSFDDFEAPEDCTSKFAFQLGGYGTSGENYTIKIDNVVIRELPKIARVQISNGDFSKGKDGWWGIEPVDGVGTMSVEGGKTNPWDVMCGYYSTFKLEKGRTYSVCFDLASDKEQDIKFQVANADNKDSELALKTFKVPGDSLMHTYKIEELEVNEDCAAKFAFQLGGFGTEGENYSIRIDNVIFTYPDLTIPAADNDPYANMVKNPKFDDGTKYWNIMEMFDGEAELSAVNGEGVVKIANTGTEDYSIQFYQDGLKLYNKNKYKFSFRYKADTERIMQVRIQQNGGTYTGYLDEKLSVTDEWKTFEKEFVMAYDNDTAARLCINLGVAGTATEVDQSIFIDDFSFTMTEGVIPGEVKPNPIRLNQVGYRPDDAKVAFIVSEDRTFKLYTSDNKLLMTGNTPIYKVDAKGNPVNDIKSGDITRTADFTKLKQKGSYYLKVRADKSPVFSVDYNIYDNLTNAVLKMFYYQRCGGDGLTEKYVGDTFMHDPCHMGEAVFYNPDDPTYGDVEIDVSGGWHDAGDYGRYITPASKTVADLLMTAEYFPSVKDLNFGGPVKILDEARYEIEWMLKMQNPVTGGVYHKVTTKDHAAMTTLPENDKAQLYLSDVSVQATADFAAVMAYAYRMYNSADKAFADTCLLASQKAWGWLKANPDADAYIDSSFFGTGTYNDMSADDERFWAAAELYKSTGSDEYLTYIKGNTLPKPGFGWADMGSYALNAYLTTEGIDTNDELYKTVKNRFIKDANDLVDLWKNDGYKVALDKYYWGSNMNLADNAMTLIIANKLEPDDNYTAAVMDQLDYLLGRNANDISYLTGIGEKAAKHPHHRQSIIKGQAVPGMLVGGPNGDIMTVEGDPVSKLVDKNTPPAKCYGDLDGSYATNEICIYWNSPLVFMLGDIYHRENTLPIMTEKTSKAGDWTLYSLSNTKASAVETGIAAVASISKTGTSEDDIQLVHAPYQLTGGAYELKISVDASAERLARIVLEKADESMETIADEVVLLESGSNDLTVPFSIKEDTSAKLSVHIGYFNADGKLAAHTVTVGAAEFTRTGDYVDPATPPEEEDPKRYDNRITNGDFNSGNEGWWGIESADGVGVVNVPGGKTNAWDVMCGNFMIFELNKDRTYKVSFDLSSEVEQIVKVQVVKEDDTQLVLKSFEVPGDGAMHTYSFDDFEVLEDCIAKTAFQLGGYGTANKNYKIKIDNLDLRELPNVLKADITNGDFSSGKEGWWNIEPADGAGVVNVPGGKVNPWDVMCGNYLTFGLLKDTTYTVSFDLASDTAQDVNFQVVNADDQDIELITKTFKVPGDGVMHTYTFNDFKVTDNCAAKFSFMLGGFGTAGKTYSIRIDNVVFTYPKTSTPDNDPTANMLRNADFSQGTKNWSAMGMMDGVGTFSVTGGEGVVNVKNTGTVDYGVQFYQDGVKLYKGNKYKLSFRYKASEARNGQVRIQQNGGTYIGYLDGALAFTTGWQTFEKEFTMSYDNDTAARLCINLGVAGEATAVNQKIYFDDFSLIMTEGTIPEAPKPNSIRLNQVGYRPDDAKVAFVVSKDRTFKLYTSDNKLVMTGNTPVYSVDSEGNPVEGVMSGDITRSADFSSIRVAGDYYIKVRADKSPVFKINENVYDDLTAAVLKFFYYQRCGGEGLTEEYVGDTFKHDPCHTEKALYYKPEDPTYGSVEIDVSGGWHDAGDYGRYITPASKAVADLLLAAENFTAINDLDFGGPGKILDEARYEIEWMLKMQNPVTGAVYHKVTTKNHAAMTALPEDDLYQLYLSPVSAQATGDFAAIMAYAYRMYGKIDADFANTCLSAAEKAWAWLAANPAANSYVDDRTFFGTGDYNDSNSADERFWAAAELYRSTKADKYLSYIQNNDLPRAGFGWGDMGSYALAAYLSTEGVDKNSSLYNSIKNRFINDANKIINTWSCDEYKVALDDYVWGSNKDLSDRTMILILANKLAPNSVYDKAIMDQLDYILGRNANDISYVTGFGEKAAKHPHHRQSVIKNQAVPGMLVGGPNGDIITVAGDPVSKMVDESTPEAKCYADLDGSYATNEICIYWNSPLVFILGYVYEQ